MSITVQALSTSRQGSFDRHCFRSRKMEKCAKMLSSAICCIEKSVSGSMKDCTAIPSPALTPKDFVPNPNTNIFEQIKELQIILKPEKDECPADVFITYYSAAMQKLSNIKKTASTMKEKILSSNGTAGAQHRAITQLLSEIGKHEETLKGLKALKKS